MCWVSGSLGSSSRSSKLKDLNTGWPAQRDRGELLAVISSVQVGGVYRLRTIAKKEEGRGKKEEGRGNNYVLSDILQLS